MAYQNPSNLTSFYDLFNWAHEVSGGTFMSMMVVVFTIIVGGAVFPFAKSISQAFTFACFFGMVASMLFGYLGFVSGYYYMLYVVFVGIGIVWMRFDRNV